MQQSQTKRLISSLHVIFILGAFQGIIFQTNAQNEPIIIPMKVSHDAIEALQQQRKAMKSAYDRESWFDRLWDRSVKDMDIYINEVRKLEGMGSFGEISFPSNISVKSSKPLDKNYELRRIPVNYNLIPAKDDVNKLRYIQSIHVDITIKDALKKNSIEVVDVLPATFFKDGDYKMDVSETYRFVQSSQLNIGASGSVGNNVASASASGDFHTGVKDEKTTAFQWSWHPKNLIVASGQVGNRAYFDFEPKGNDEFYVGVVPIEILCKIPVGIKEAKMEISNTLRGKAGHLDFGNSTVAVHFD
jgi:hypothetical protein